MSSSSSLPSVSVKRTLVIVLLALVIVASLQIEPAESGKSDLLFVKGKFIKRDKKGTIVIDDKCPKCCHHGSSSYQ